jgi:predicted RNase H-related nuclease YkuK (DUF458 family)
MKWKTLSNLPVPSIKEWVRDSTAVGQEVHVGTDSQVIGYYVEFVTVVVIHTVGKGGRVAYKREHIHKSKINSLRQRLLQEVWYSVDCGLELAGDIGNDLTVHIDANPVQTHESSKYIQELVGLVVGQGFKHKVKPDAWVATHVADHAVRR